MLQYTVGTTIHERRDAIDITRISIYAQLFYVMIFVLILTIGYDIYAYKFTLTITCYSYNVNGMYLQSQRILYLSFTDTCVCVCVCVRERVCVRVYVCRDCGIVLHDAIICSMYKSRSSRDVSDT